MPRQDFVRDRVRAVPSRVGRAETAVKRLRRRKRQTLGPLRQQLPAGFPARHPELERTADLVEHTAVGTPQGLAELAPAGARDLLVDMATLAAEMWCSALEGFVARDPSVGIIRQVRDEALDDLHVEFTEELAESGCRAAFAIEMGLIARFYERLGDHAVNLANRAVNLIDF